MSDPGNSQYGPFLIMQYGGVLLVLIGLAFAVYRGTRDRKISTDQDNAPGGIRWFFDGPLNAALQTMHDTYKIMCSIDRHVETFGEEFRAHTKLLEEARRLLIDIKELLNRQRHHD